LPQLLEAWLPIRLGLQQESAPTSGSGNDHHADRQDRWPPGPVPINQRTCKVQHSHARQVMQALERTTDQLLARREPSKGNVVTDLGEKKRSLGRPTVNKSDGLSSMLEKHQRQLPPQG